MNKTNCTSSVQGTGSAPAPETAQAQIQGDQPAEALATAEAAPPDQPPTKEQLVTLFEVMRLREQMQGLLNQTFMRAMPAMIQQQILVRTKIMVSKLPAGASMTAEQQAAIEKLRAKYMQKVLEVYLIDELIEDLEAVYQRHLRSSDADALIAFHRSPVGQLLLDAKPAIMREFMPLATIRRQESLKPLIDELTWEMEKIFNFQGPAAEKPVIH